MSAEILLFYAFALLALFSAVAMVAFVRNVVAGAMSLVVTMLSLSGIFVLLGAEFVGAVQVIVYAGAIMVLLLFVIMLFNLEVDEFGPEPLGRGIFKLAAAVVAALLCMTLLVVLPESGALPEPNAELMGGHRELGLALFGRFVLPLEVTGLLLLSAIVGAVILAKQRID
jgi:NADH-quinone oxidoreductase subunit J